jgi:hypothetical protein
MQPIEIAGRAASNEALNWRRVSGFIVPPEMSGSHFRIGFHRDPVTR